MYISIVITHFNKKNLLKQAIKSVYNQLKFKDEIIIVDDNSKDKESLSTLDYIANNYNNITIQKNKINYGASEAKNIGIKLAKNDIIVLLDADDTLPDKSLENIRQPFILFPDIDFLFGNYIRNEIAKETTELINCREISNETNTINPYMLVKKWILLGTSPFKKSLYDKLYGFDKLHPRTDDRDFHIKAILNNAHFYFTDAIIYNWHRYSDGNNSKIPNYDTLSSFFRNIDFYFNYMSKKRFMAVLLKNFFKIIFIKLCK